jgi:hypothetical protein
MESNESRQLIPSVEGTALEAYGNRQIIGELVDRLMSFHPASAEVGKVGMLQAAQLAILMGASPLPATNEIHIWKQKGKVMVMPGINYWRRRSTYYGGIWWVDEPRPMTEEESIRYGILNTELGAFCKAVRQIDVDQFLAKEIPWQVAIKAKAQSGIGTVRKNETAKNGRPLLWSAIKRAETDLLRQLFPYQPGEQFQPGAGLLQANDGTYEINSSDRQWGGLDLSLDEYEIPEAEFSVDEVNEMFGLNTNTEPEYDKEAHVIEVELVTETPTIDPNGESEDTRAETPPQEQGKHEEHQPTTEPTNGNEQELDHLTLALQANDLHEFALNAFHVVDGYDDEYNVVGALTQKWPEAHEQKVFRFTSGKVDEYLQWLADRREAENG